MKTPTRILFVLPLAAALTGCEGKGDDTITGSTGGVLDPCDAPGATDLFAVPYWPAGSAFHPAGTPAFSACGPGAVLPVGDPVANSNPALGTSVPRPADDISYHGEADLVLASAHIDALIASYNNGRPSAAGDLLVLPNPSTGMPAGETFCIMLIDTGAILDSGSRRAPAGGTPRTRVVAIAFGDGQGGYVPAPPNTADPFATALVWMKATRNPYAETWSMEQADWRTGSAVNYPTSLRLVIRDDAAMAIVRKQELTDLGVTRFRWDVFSYTTDPATEWSHDFTDWIALE